MTRIIGIWAMLFTVVLVLNAPARAGEAAVIAVAAEADTAAAQVSSQAARSPYFLLFDARGAFVEAVANPHRQAAGGAGPQVAQFLAEKGIQTVIAGEFGAKMTGAMQGRGMAYRTATGSAANAARTAVNQ